MISHPGEYTTPDELEKFGYWLTNNNIQYNKKKVVLSVDEYIEENGWEIFEYPFSALRFFCGAITQHSFHMVQIITHLWVLHLTNSQSQEYLIV